MTGTVLRPMRVEVFAAYLEEAVADYAEDNVTAGRWPRHGANGRATSSPACCRKAWPRRTTTCSRSWPAPTASATCGLPSSAGMAKLARLSMTRRCTRCIGVRAMPSVPFAPSKGWWPRWA